MYPVVLTGPCVRLRELRADDLDPLMDVVGDPEVTRTLSIDPPSREEQSDRLAKDMASAKEEPRSVYVLAIDDAAEGLVGFVTFGIAGNLGGEVGCAVRRADWGKGYAAEATRLIIDFGFGTLDAHRIQAACGPDNRASQRLLTRLGMIPEGRIRDHVFTNGAWRDSLLYSILKPEWESLRGEPGWSTRPARW